MTVTMDGASWAVARVATLNIGGSNYIQNSSARMPGMAQFVDLTVWRKSFEY